MSTAGPAHRIQSAAVEYGYPQGHLGHLSPDEETAFENFKALCVEKEYFKPAEGEDTSATHDDATLLRFLRARRFVVQDAFKQFQDTEEWRKATQLDELYETIDLEQYEETRRLYPQWTGRRDRRGIPVYIFEVKHLNAKTMSAYEKSAKDTKTKAKTDGKIPAKLLRLFALYENLTRFVMPLCTALTDREYPRTPITQSNNIVDISGVGLKQFWNLRGHMQDASTLATAHYPETLDRIFIIGAPAFFPTVWGWIKKWFDPITTSKIFILSSADVKKTLESFIDPVNIPRKYGGQLEFEFGDKPVLDPAIGKVTKWEVGKQSFPDGPLHWVDKKKGAKFEVGREEGNGKTEIRALAVGSIGGEQRKEVVCTITRILEASTDVGNSGASWYAAAGTEKSVSHLTVPGAVAMAPALTTRPLDEQTLKVETDASPTANGMEVAVQDEEVVPATRPVPLTFVTAQEGIQTLSLSEKPGNLANGLHEMSTVNRIYPSLTAPGTAVRVGNGFAEHANGSADEDKMNK